MRHTYTAWCLGCVTLHLLNGVTVCGAVALCALLQGEQDVCFSAPQLWLLGWLDLPPWMEVALDPLDSQWRLENRWVWVWLTHTGLRHTE